MGPPAAHYELHAIIAEPEVFSTVVERFRHVRPTLLDGAELALVPMCADLFAEIDLPGFPVDDEWGFERLSSGVAAMIVASSRRGPVAYLEAEYTAGVGHQTAAVWLDCHRVYGPTTLLPGEHFPVPRTAYDEASPIVEALRYLGVQAVGRRDEFVVLGLARHRTTEQWCAAWAST